MLFHRKPGEGIDSFLSRFDLVRNRAATEGQFTVPAQQIAIMLLQETRIQGGAILHSMLEPFGLQLPNTEAQIQELMTKLRRYGHATEHRQGNVSFMLGGHYNQARPTGEYLSLENSGSPGSLENSMFFGNTSASPHGTSFQAFPVFGNPSGSMMPDSMVSAYQTGVQNSQQSYDRNRRNALGASYRTRREFLGT